MGRRRKLTALIVLVLSVLLATPAGADPPGSGGQGNSGNPGNNHQNGENDGHEPPGLERSPMRVSLERSIAELDPDEVLTLQLHTEPGQLDSAIDVVERHGGNVRTSFDTLIIAELPVESVEAVANSAPVRLAGEFVRPQHHNDRDPVVREYQLPDGVHLDETPVVMTDDPDIPISEGVEITRANDLHEVGITGENVTIAILDTGFNIDNPQYADQVVATLGADEDHPNFGDAYRLAGGHGDGVTDIVAAMAPDADLILADMFDTIPGFGLFEAIEEIEANYDHVDVVNYSVGHLVDFRIDGFDPISLRLAEFTEATGSIFVNSAGNSAAVENAWVPGPGFEPVPIPQNIGDVFHTGGPGQFTDRGQQLLQFDANYEMDLEVSTRLPITTFQDVTALTGPIGWTVTHWDADPVADDQFYMTRLFEDAETSDPLVVSRTRNPWETVDVLGEYFVGDTRLTIDVVDGDWQLTDVNGQPDVGEIGESSPVMTFPEAQRYRVFNDAWREHPFELYALEIDDDGNDVRVPLLSQAPGVHGVFEDDPLVDWQDRGRWFEFTVNIDLANAMHGGLYTSANDDGIGNEVFSALPLPIYLEIQRIRADENHHFDVWASFGGVNIPTPWAQNDRTIGIPALSQDEELLAIGAVQAVDFGPNPGQTNTAFELNAGDLKGYSSQGRTQDGRRGIDLAAPSHVSTYARGAVHEIPVGFLGMNGTSAAAPHVAGAVGLLMQESDDRGAVREALAATGTGIADPAVPDPGPDNTQIGDGQIDVFAAYELMTGD